MSEQISLFKTGEIIDENTVSVDKVIFTKKLKVISLFSGCGGMDLGFRGGFDVFGKHYESNPYDIIFANDIIKKACETYEHNFGHKPHCGDIKELDYKTLPKADIVIGGFPCQDFSLAGKRKGLASERGKLYLEMKNVIEHCNPIAFVAENVDGIRKSKAGDDTTALDIIIEDFKSMGYEVVYKVVNAADYGVPQNRIRVIIVGIRKDINKKMKYPEITHGELGKYKWMSSKEAIDDLWDKIGVSEIKDHTERHYSKAKFYPGKRMQGNRQIDANRPSPTIRAEHHGNIEGHYRSMDPNNPDDMTSWRRLSIRECARLQSFPDNFEFPCAPSEAYKQIGNAVPPILGWNIARALYKSLFMDAQ